MPSGARTQLSIKRIARKTAPPRPGAKSRVTRPTRRPSKKATSRPVAITAEERLMMIARAAYFAAERRGFAPGYELEDWLSAEREVDQRLKGPAE